MASFIKRGKTWQYTVSRMVDGEYDPIRKGGFKTKKEAQIAAAEVEAELAKGIAPHLKPEPFNDYFNNWVKVFKSHVKRNTLERYKTTHNTIDEYFGNKPLQEIKKREYQQFLNEYAKTRSRSTVSKLNTHIRSCVKEAIDEGIIRVDFTRGVNIAGLEGKRSEDKHLSYEESKLLLKEIRKNLHVSPTYYVLLLALTTGMRFGEIVGLTRKDFNFFNNTISINKIWGYSKRMNEGFGSTKNDQSVRVIKVDSQTMSEFKKLFERTPENIHKLVFYSPSSKYKVVSNGATNKLLRNVLKRLGIDRVSIHGLRHTHASVLLYKDVSIYYTSERLGHKDTKTTINEYAHVIKELRSRDEKRSINVYKKMYV